MLFDTRTTSAFELLLSNVADSFYSKGNSGTATYKPGEKAPNSGEPVEIGPRGGKAETGRRLVIQRGETIPPTSEAGNQFKYKLGSKTTH